jgi:hypothetical protein
MMGWQTNVGPSAKDGHSRYGAADNGPNIDSTTTEEILEALVLEILERMGGELS